MSTDPSNNIMQEPPINNTPSMETQDYFQYIMNSTMNIEHDIDHMHPIQSTRRSNFISSFLNHLDSNSPTQSIPPGNNILSSLGSDTSSNSTDNINLYMRFIEDILQLPPLTTNNNLRNLLRETLNDKNPIKNVLSAKGEQKIETIEFDPEIYTNISSCPITIKEFKKGDIISKLPCNHLFNTDAILKWLKEEKAECPICRFKLESIEKNLEINDSSYNTLQGDGVIHPRNTRHSNMRAMNAFRPPRMPRRQHNIHLRRLMLSRHEREEQEELQVALLASLENQYMPGHTNTSDIDLDSDMDMDSGSDTDEMDKVD